MFEENYNYFLTTKRKFHRKLFKHHLNQDYFFKRKTFYNKNQNKFEINKRFDKIMIVSHFDDEVIFGGEELIKYGKDYLVIVCTFSVDDWRLKGFFKNKEVLNLDNLISYCNFDCNNKEVYFEKEFIIDLKEFIKNNIHSISKIVTHNKNGEYEHIQHKQIHEIVVDICKELNVLEKLNVFHIDETYNYDSTTMKTKIKLLNNYGIDENKMDIQWKPGFYHSSIKQYII